MCVCVYICIYVCVCMNNQNDSILAYVESTNFII